MGKNDKSYFYEKDKKCQEPKNAMEIMVNFEKTVIKMPCMNLKTGVLLIFNRSHETLLLSFPRFRSTV